MKICRYRLRDETRARIGVQTPDGIRDVSEVADGLPSMRWPLPPGDLFIANLDTLRGEIERLAKTAPLTPEADAHFLAPVANPNKILCGIGNWAHWQKLSGKSPAESGFFVKAVSSLAGVSDGVVFPHGRDTVHEMELAIIIGKEGRNIPAERALDHVAGYAHALDMTLRGPEDFSFRKSPDSYAIIGPWMTTADEIPDPGTIDYRFFINDALNQEHSFDQLLLSPAQLIEMASRVMTLYPGDIVLSGTPVMEAVPADAGLRAESALLGTMETRTYGGAKPA